MEDLGGEGVDWIGKGGLGEDLGGEGVVRGALTFKVAAAGGMDEEGVVQTKGSVLIDGGGEAC